MALATDADPGDPAPPRRQLETILLSGGLAAVFIEWLRAQPIQPRRARRLLQEATLTLGTNTPGS